MKNTFYYCAVFFAEYIRASSDSQLKLLEWQIRNAKDFETEQKRFNESMKTYIEKSECSKAEIKIQEEIKEHLNNEKHVKEFSDELKDMIIKLSRLFNFLNNIIVTKIAQKVEILTKDKSISLALLFKDYNSAITCFFESLQINIDNEFCQKMDELEITRAFLESSIFLTIHYALNSPRSINLYEPLNYLSRNLRTLPGFKLFSSEPINYQEITEYTDDATKYSDIISNFLDRKWEAQNDYLAKKIYFINDKLEELTIANSQYSPQIYSLKASINSSAGKSALISMVDSYIRTNFHSSLLAIISEINSEILNDLNSK